MNLKCLSKHASTVVPSMHAQKDMIKWYIFFKLQKKNSQSLWRNWETFCETSPAGTQRNNNVFITSKRRRRRRLDVMKTLSFRHYCVMCPLGRHWSSRCMVTHRRNIRFLEQPGRPCKPWAGRGKYWAYGSWLLNLYGKHTFEGLEQVCGSSNVLAMDIPQSCTKPSVRWAVLMMIFYIFTYANCQGHYPKMAMS